MAFQVDPRNRARRLGTPEPGTATTHTLPLGDPTGGADALLWRELVDGPSTYPRVHVDRGVTVHMSDGARLRATVIRPANTVGAPVAEPLPTVVNINPYNRLVVDAIDQGLHAPIIGKALHKASAAADLSGTPLGGVTDLTRTVSGGVFDVFGINRSLVRSGYVQVIVDVRGTGASTGKWQILGEREQLDSVEVLNWIAAQPWCDGAVGMAGWSYSAINSLQAADKRPECLKAVFAVEGCEDIVRDIYITGGAPSFFIPFWLTVVNAVKWVPNPTTPVRDLLGGHTLRWLIDRVKSPATELGTLAKGFITGDDPRLFDDPFFDERDPEVENIVAPTFLFGGWHDLFGRGTPRTFARLQLPAGQKQLMMFDGYHLNAGAGLGRQFDPPRLDVLERAWFDRWLKGIDNGVDRYGPVTIEQQGGSWSCGPSFPRPGFETTTCYLSPVASGTAEHAKHDGTLKSTISGHAAELPVNPDVRGLVSRDMTQVTAGVTMVLGKSFTTDARYQERGGLSFTSAPVVDPVQISGALNLHLRAIGETHEQMWAVTVNDVAPDGTSTVLTNGALMGSNRTLDPDRSEYDEDGELLLAHHPLTRPTKQPVRPGEAIELDIDLVPTDAILEPGHRLRVDIYAGSFPRFLSVIPDIRRIRRRPQRLVLDPLRPSYLTLRTLGETGWR